MDKYTIKRIVEKSFYNKNKEELTKIINQENLPYLRELLWEYLEESDSSIKAKEDLTRAQKELTEIKNRILAMETKSGQRVKCIKVMKSERKALVQMGPLREEVLISPSVNVEDLMPGTEVLVIGSQDGRLIAGIRESSSEDGRLSKIKRMVGNRVVIENAGTEYILKVADGIECKENDEIRYDVESLMVFEVIPSNEQKEYSLSNFPEETFFDVKGLEEEKQYLQERVIAPVAHSKKFLEYGIKPIRGIMLHGAPGCGKTMLAGAIFNEIKILREKSSPTLKQKTDRRGFFVINGPEILSKWAGQSEETIRNIFRCARETAKDTGFPSIIFWDEIESIAGKRKDVDTYTPEKTVVPTLLAELQGLEKDNDILLIAASNRPDLIDPALLRPGRLGDVIIEIPKPNKNAAEQILKSRFIKENIPENLKKLVDQDIINKIVEHIYDNKNPIITTKSNNKIVNIFRKDKINGALFANIGEEIVRKICIKEIQKEEEMTINDALKMIDKILLMQLGIIDAGVKHGFEINNSDLIIDVTMQD